MRFRTFFGFRTEGFRLNIAVLLDVENGGGGRIRTYEHPDSESGGFDLLHTLPYRFARWLATNTTCSFPASVKFSS